LYSERFIFCTWRAFAYSKASSTSRNSSRGHPFTYSNFDVLRATIFLRRSDETHSRFGSENDRITSSLIRS
jgi:hypothetical protein